MILQSGVEKLVEIRLRMPPDDPKKCESDWMVLTMRCGWWGDQSASHKM